MNTHIDQVRENMGRLSDADLARVVGERSQDYSEEALAAAREELARRGIAPGTVPAEPEAPAVADEPDPELSVAGTGRKRRFWGAVLLVVAAFVIYAALLGIGTIVVGKQHGMVANSDAPFRLAFYAAIIALCLWAGIKRHPRWELVFGLSLVVMGILCYLPRLSLDIATTTGAVMTKAALYASIALIALGAVFLLFALLAPRSAARS